jgi:hypothetical protein
VSELLGWLGLPASIVVAFVAISGAFRALEQIASPAAKANLSNFLRSADWTILPHTITAAYRDLFEAIFGSSHFSAKSLRRSFLFSLMSISALLFFGFVRHYSYFRTMPDEVLYHPTYKIYFSWVVNLDCAFRLFQSVQNEAPHSADR